MAIAEINKLVERNEVKKEATWPLAYIDQGVVLIGSISRKKLLDFCNELSSQLLAVGEFGVKMGAFTLVNAPVLHKLFLNC